MSNKGDEVKKQFLKSEYTIWCCGVCGGTSSLLTFIYIWMDGAVRWCFGLVGFADV